MSRLEPLVPPYSEDVAKTLQRMMPPGVAPLALFRTMAHNPHILDKLRSTGAYLLNHGTLPERDRELVIQRTTARCNSEYEWGVHAAFYGERIGLTNEQIDATKQSSTDDAIWNDNDRHLIRLVDELHETSAVSNGLWHTLANHYTPEQLVELVYLVGQYQTISFVTNAFQIDLEPSAKRFPKP